MHGPTCIFRANLTPFSLEKDVGQAHGVTGYPTLLVFKKGKALGKYSGKREVAEIVAHMKGVKRGKPPPPPPPPPGPVTRRAEMPRLAQLDPQLACDACLTTVERFLGVWNTATAKVEKEQGSASKDLRSAAATGKDGPSLNINEHVTGAIVRRSPRINFQRQPTAFRLCTSPSHSDLRAG